MLPILNYISPINKIKYPAKHLNKPAIFLLVLVTDITMCGRFTLVQRLPYLRLNEIDDFVINNDFELYNIAPYDKGHVIFEDDGEVKVDLMNWGFRPSWAKASYAKINAKSENMFDGKMFKHSALHRRCLIVADGFYEPRGPKTQKQRPWYYF